MSGLSLNQDKAEQCGTGLNLTHYVYDLGKDFCRAETIL